MRRAAGPCARASQLLRVLHVGEARLAAVPVDLEGVGRILDHRLDRVLALVAAAGVGGDVDRLATAEQVLHGLAVKLDVLHRHLEALDLGVASEDLEDLAQQLRDQAGRRDAAGVIHGAGYREGLARTGLAIRQDGRVETGTQRREGGLTNLLEDLVLLSSHRKDLVVAKLGALAVLLGVLELVVIDGEELGLPGVRTDERLQAGVHARPGGLDGRH